MTVHSSLPDDAACRDADPDLFFPVGTTGHALRHIDEAKPSGGRSLARLAGEDVTSAQDLVYSLALEDLADDGISRCTDSIVSVALAGDARVAR